VSEWTEPCYEPSLMEILGEPIVRALMERDRVEQNEIIELLTRFEANSPKMARAAA
jgi:hypothetical protein